MSKNSTSQDYAIYVHIPFCKARCGYCAFSSCTDFGLAEKYFDVLCAEIERAVVPSEGKAVTMFWGGGTPSSVHVALLQKLYSKLCAKFDFSNLIEFTVECNPESTTRQLLEFLKCIGVNRLSFGLQSVNNQTLMSIGRLHNFEVFLNALRLAHEVGFQNINADLILGLPESADQFKNTVKRVVELPLQHISLYALEIHEENVTFKKLCEKFAFDDDELACLYDFARENFQRAGFLRYEVSNFAKNGCECKHNLMYWRENRYFGFGAAASGFLQGIRYGNAFSIVDYIASNGKKLEYCEEISFDEEMYEFVMLGLRLQNGFSATDFFTRFGVEFAKAFPNCNKLLDLGFLSVENERIKIADDKFYVLNSILTELLPD